MAPFTFIWLIQNKVIVMPQKQQNKKPQPAKGPQAKKQDNKKASSTAPKKK